MFTPKRFGGNQLAVFPSAEGLTDEEMQCLAVELNYSETTFVVPAREPDCDARVRIFNRTAEMPFAGHPNVGTAADEINEVGERLSIFAYARHGDKVRSRMFAPLSGTWEDPATGSANATLGALLLSLGRDDELELRSVQGVEMGRESHLQVRSWRNANGIFASVAGDCVPVLKGQVAL